MRKCSILLVIFALAGIQIAFAQSVGIGTATPNASARLEVNSTNQGILIPTLTSVQRNAINNPVNGLLIFQTNGTPGFYYYNGIAWINLTNGTQPDSEGIALSLNYGLTTTFAGSGSPGNADGTGTAASFDVSTGIATDVFGNVYVADRDNHKIRKITAAGVVSTLAGSGSSGNADGIGTAASFNQPYGIAVDVSGNVYVADRFNYNIRKITVAGVVSTLAGSGSASSVDGIGTAASFNQPTGIAVDVSGNVYVTDFGSNKIRKITAAGVVTTLAGSGSAGSTDGDGIQASFSTPYSVAVDASGNNIYVADYGNNKIRRITGAGIVTTLAGSGSAGSTDGAGTTASFNGPAGVAVDAYGNVYAAEITGNKIRKIIAGGVVSTLAGSGLPGSTDGMGIAASFYTPFGIAVDAAGNLYVSDVTNYRIRKIIAR